MSSPYLEAILDHHPDDVGGGFCSRAHVAVLAIREAYRDAEVMPDPRQPVGRPGLEADLVEQDNVGEPADHENNYA
jgi:hypothetical protein